MKKFYLLFIAFSLSFSVKAQLVSYQLQESFNIPDLQAFLDNSGFALPLTPQYEVDVYQIFYKTPYKHIDSLVTTSGIVAIPKNVACPSILTAYGHGTFTKRTQSASFNAAERPITFLFAGFGGIVTVMPDVLGLGEGEGDSSIIIHPYINKFHNGHTIINSMRAVRELTEVLDFQLNGEVVLAGFSQGGHTTMSANRLIQEEYSEEFNVRAALPMTGPYDLNKTMVDVMLSNDPFSSPSYLPYLLLGYHSVYESLQTLYPDPSAIFKHPYDSILPPMYYSGDFTTGDIDQFTNPVPRDMIIDSVVQEFEDAYINGTSHPLLDVLADNDLMNWAPENHVRINYCTEDEQVTFLNAVRADSAWQANGSTNIVSFDHGPFSHAGCVEPSITNSALFLLSITPVNCTSIDELGGFEFKAYPNPTSGIINLETEIESATIKIMDLNGRLVFEKTINSSTKLIDINHLLTGVYFAEIRDERGNSTLRKIIKE